MHIVLSVLGWALLTLLALLGLALALPVSVLLEYKDEAFSATLRLFFVWKLRLYPLPPKPDEPEQAPKPKPSDAQGASKKTKKPLPQLTLEKVWGLVSTAGAAMRIVLRGLWIHGIRIVWPIHEGDAAQTAIAYGKAQAYFGGAVASLRNFLHLKFKQVDFLADYDDKFAQSTYLYCTITATPIIMVAAGVYALVRILREHLLW